MGGSLTRIQRTGNTVTVELVGTRKKDFPTVRVGQAFSFKTVEGEEWRGEIESFRKLPNVDRYRLRAKAEGRA